MRTAVIALVPKRRGMKAGLSVLISDIQDALDDRAGGKNDVLALLTSTGSFDATVVAVGFEGRFSCDNTYSSSPYAAASSK